MSDTSRLNQDTIASFLSENNITLKNFEWKQWPNKVNGHVRTSDIETCTVCCGTFVLSARVECFDSGLPITEWPYTITITLSLSQEGQMIHLTNDSLEAASLGEAKLSAMYQLLLIMLSLDMETYARYSI